MKFGFFGTTHTAHRTLLLHTAGAGLGGQTTVSRSETRALTPIARKAGRCNGRQTGCPSFLACSTPPLRHFQPALQDPAPTQSRCGRAAPAQRDHGHRPKMPACLPKALACTTRHRATFHHPRAGTAPHQTYLQKNTPKDTPHGTPLLQRLGRPGPHLGRRRAGLCLSGRLPALVGQAHAVENERL